MDGSINLPLGGVVAGYTTDSQQGTIKAKDNRYSDRTSPSLPPLPLDIYPLDKYSKVMITNTEEAVLGPQYSLRMLY